jgi:hypothetical protein
MGMFQVVGMNNKKISISEGLKGFSKNGRSENVKKIEFNGEYLVTLDTGSIHEYIFGTNKLREIRGASILLDKLNRKIPKDELEKYGTENADYKCILAGGGNIKVLFSDETKAIEYEADLKRIFKEKVGVRFTTNLSERKGDQDQQWINRAERELQRKKDLHKESFQIISSGFFKACQACGLYPAETEDVHVEERRYICKSCHQKIQESDKKNYTQTEIYKRLFEKIGFKPELPSNFNEIGQKSEPKGYIGFIYADGNRMGEHLAKISSFDELERFSMDVDDATLDATVTALTNQFKEDFPFQIILAGGDDLIIAIPANKAIDVAVDFCKSFEEKLKLKSRDITTSASIVICHDSLPIKNILDAAESLIKNAKAESRKNGGGSYLDFIVVTGSSLENPVEKRKRELEYSNYFGVHSITKKPYSLKEIEKLRIAIHELKKVDFPNNKLNALYTSLFKGHNQSILDSLYTKTRLQKEHRAAIEKIFQFRLESFPWEEMDIHKFTTPIGDIYELYEFV